MRRWFGLFISSALLATIFVLGGGADPARSAACAGQGNAHLTKKIGLPVLGDQVNVGFTITGKCTVGGGTAFATGTIANAACGRSTGGVGKVNGVPFTFQTAASIGVLQGKAKGVFNAVSDVRKGDSCTNTTADDFLVTSVIKGDW